MKQQNVWTSRGYLPHYHSTEKSQFITYRLADALPRSVIEKAKRQVELFPSEKQSQKKILLLGKYLDQGVGCCVLQKKEIATRIIDNWFYFHQTRYELMEWVVMPNHVHVLVKIFAPWSLGQVLHSWKSYTANLINHHLTENHRPPLQPVWQREYWDRYIRGPAHYQKVVAYIRMNPVKAGLCRHPQEWPFSSGAAGAPPARRQL